MKAAGYVRVSTTEQAREGISIEMQREKIRQYAALKDLDLIEIVSDEGISGKSIKARPGVQRVLDMVCNKEVGAVVTYKLDRLARNTIETLEMVNLMDKAGVSLHSITEDLNTQSAIGRFVVRTLASLAEMERDLISERTKAALDQKRSKGEKLGGNPPYGWMSVDGALVENPSEQRVIARINELKTEGFTTREIAAALDRDGYRTRKGTTWSHTQVIRIMRAA